MQAFKIDYYLREHPEAPTPRFSALSQSEEAEVVAALLAGAGSPKGDPHAIMRQLEGTSMVLDGFDLSNKQVALSNVFEACGVRPESEIYIQWGALCEIDRFDLSDLEQCFYEVWYAGSDDIELFDRTFRWLVFVRHYGGVSVWRPAGDLRIKPTMS